VLIARIHVTSKSQANSALRRPRARDGGTGWRGHESGAKECCFWRARCGHERHHVASEQPLTVSDRAAVAMHWWCADERRSIALGIDLAGSMAGACAGELPLVVARRSRRQSTLAFSVTGGRSEPMLLVSFGLATPRGRTIRVAAAAGSLLSRAPPGLSATQVVGRQAVLALRVTGRPFW
jgi:hypothetical protein